LVVAVSSGDRRLGIARPAVRAKGATPEVLPAIATSHELLERRGGTYLAEDELRRVLHRSSVVAIQLEMRNRCAAHLRSALGIATL
jgi:hypothetical protein